MNGISRNRRRFNPFNLVNTDEDGNKRIKFERLPQHAKTKPIWWLFFVFVIILIIYQYLSKSV
jgi:hypothetical protein